MTMELAVPVVDIGLLMSLASDADVHQHMDELQPTVETLRQAATEWGFFYIAHHGVTATELQQFQTAMRAFFHLPKHVKATIKRSANNSRGYFDDELTKNQTDWKEGLDFAGEHENGPAEPVTPSGSPTRMLQDQNQWLDEDTLPAFKHEMMTYFARMEQVARRLLMLFALALDQELTCFDQFFDHAHAAQEDRNQDQRRTNASFLRLNYYPVAPQPESTMAVHHHTDAGALTVLLQDDDVASLQVLHRDTNQWVLIPPKPGTFVINIGDMLQVWSNDQFQAPLHRVLANGTRERFSAPFFYNPAYSSVVQPLVVDAKPTYRPISWYDFRLQRFQGDYADVGEEIQISHFQVAA
ncbi:TPA: hypothetical protein N0F65_006583 [Lagenidium giganteum]|uniref:Fe2OG dioxygenase domain-containing protein n=1 Tax=Lagenidium giganteum TaxID=4803 RepID=A0AAV2ZC67_9STRA|nr:TPA: hypothetical protein N0F65_006583 [Lagenidium giganteum]